MTTREPVPEQGGLNVHGTLGLSTAHLEQIRQQFDTTSEVDRFATEYGLEIPMKVNVPAPVTGAFLNEARSHEYTETYAEWLAYYNFLVAVQAHTRVSQKQLSTQLENIYAQLKKDNGTINRARPRIDRFSQDELEAEIKCDETYRYVLSELQAIDQKRFIIDAAVDSADRTLKLLSRQIEIMKMERDNGDREGRDVRGGSGGPPRRMTSR